VTGFIHIPNITTTLPKATLFNSFMTNDERGPHIFLFFSQMRTEDI